MRHVALLLLIAALGSACVSSPVAPKRETLRTLHTLSVVPIEPPPFVITPFDAKETRAVLALAKSNTDLGSAVTPDVGSVGGAIAQSAAGFGTTAGVVTAIGGLLMLVEAAAAGEQKANDPSALVLGNPANTWVPTTEFSRTAVAALTKSGYVSVRMIDGYVRLPVADRSVTWHMQNWQRPIRDFYDSDASSLDYLAPGAPDADAVLEVGLMSYEFAFERLMLQVFVRLVDPHTKQVLGRARRYDYPEAGPLVPLLKNDAEGMKRLIVETGNRLVVQCLADLGLDVP